MPNNIHVVQASFKNGDIIIKKDFTKAGKVILCFGNYLEYLHKDEILIGRAHNFALIKEHDRRNKPQNR